MKSIEEHFCDWESQVFGFGYGDGEEAILPALKRFMALVPKREDGSYDYRALEEGCGKEIAWLLINILCKANMFDYGTSPRFAWLSDQGIALKTFLESKTADELVMLVADPPFEVNNCTPHFCNCGPDGYSEKKLCHNPFWIEGRNGR